jgi:hypothetical protein
MPPQLRLAGEGPPLDNLPESADSREQLAGQGEAGPAQPAPLITDEELRMLLGESDTEGQQEHQ